LHHIGKTAGTAVQSLPVASGDIPCTGVAIAQWRNHETAVPSLYEILQILSLTLFEKYPMNQLLAKTHNNKI